MNLLICVRCGARTETPVVDENDPVVCCVDCGHREPFLRLPLHCVTGPSGTGKSTVARLLTPWLADRYVVLEQDILWQPGLSDPADNHRLFRSTWLRIISMIHQNSRPAVLCGMVVPPEFESLPERKLFSEIRYLSLMCDPDVLAERLRRRPAWRGWDEPRIVEILGYAAWIDKTAATMSPPMTLLDTTRTPVESTAATIYTWVTGEDQTPR